MKQDEMKKLAEMTASLVLKGLQKEKSLDHTDDNDYIDSKEAAALLGLTPNYLRSQKDKYPHIKVGNTNQGRILFKRSELLANYIK